MGERSGSRPLPLPGSFFSAGSCTWSGGDGDVGHAELVAVVERGRAAQREQQHGGGARLLGADARGEARLVVVAEHVVGPGAGGQKALVGRVMIWAMARAFQAVWMRWKLKGRLAPLSSGVSGAARLSVGLAAGNGRSSGRVRGAEDRFRR